MNIIHTGACSERFLNARLKLYPLKPSQHNWTVAHQGRCTGLWLVLSPGLVYWTVAGALTRAGVLDCGWCSHQGRCTGLWLVLSPGQVYWTGWCSHQGRCTGLWLMLSPGQVYWTVAGALTRAGVLDCGWCSHQGRCTGLWLVLSPGQVYWTAAGLWLVLSPGQVYWTVAGALTRAGVLDCGWCSHQGRCTGSRPMWLT